MTLSCLEAASGIAGSETTSIVRRDGRFTVYDAHPQHHHHHHHHHQLWGASGRYLETSEDGTTWTRVATLPGGWITGMEQRVFHLPQAVRTKLFRIAGSSAHMLIGEMRM